MSNTLTALYHRLPYPARSAAATARGWYLRYWRYGPDHHRRAHAALERERWTPERWRAWQEEQVAELLHRAATKVPYYREYWADRRRRGDKASWDTLTNWPVLEKDVVRTNPRAFLADDCDPRRMLHEQTSGTSGKPIDVWRSRSTLTELYAIAEARTRMWLGIPASVRWARLGGQLVTPVRRRQPPFWVWNAAMRQLYLSAYHLAPDLIHHYVDAMVHYGIRYLGGYTSSLTSLAHEVRRTEGRKINMLAVFTNAEPITPDQRQVITSAFNCPVRETYGMAESVAAGSECEAGNLHEWPEIGYIEVHQSGHPVRSTESGELICTGLLNWDMPLIRYRVGDTGRMAESSRHCPCGRGLPIVESIEGRTTDTLFTADGRQVFWLNPVFYGLPIEEAQIVQRRLDHLLVRVVPDTGFDQSAERTIVSRLRERMGYDVDIEVRTNESVPRTANGKLRMVVCELPEDVRSRVRAGQSVGAGTS
jgi:phenylacetate-CoA ligase